VIVTDLSIIPMPGKNAEAVAAVKENIAYVEQRWPVSPPRMLIADELDGRIRVISMRASRAESETAQAEQQADAGYQALLQKLWPLVVPGSARTTYSRVL